MAESIYSVGVGYLFELDNVDYNIGARDCASRLVNKCIVQYNLK